MAVRPFVEVGKQYPNKGEFIRVHPLPESCSTIAAIDGIVLGSGMQTVRRNGGRYIFVDHHEGDRYSQLSTAKQFWERLRNGSLNKLKVDGKFCMDIYMNHVDEDSALVYAIVNNADELFSDDALYKRAREIINLEDSIDRWLGLYDSDDVSIGHLLWIFESIHDSRFGNASQFVTSRDNFIANLFDVNERFMRFVRGEDKALQIYGSAEKIASGNNWKIIKETGPGARIQMVREGAEEGVSLYAIHAGERETGTNDYMLVCPSPDARLDHLVKSLNEEEDEWLPGENAWGGNSNFVASPRSTGSEKTPLDLAKFLENWQFEKGSFYWEI